MDCRTRQLLGWHLSRSGKASTAARALEQALINQYSSLGRMPSPNLLNAKAPADKPGNQLAFIVVEQLKDVTDR